MHNPCEHCKRKPNCPPVCHPKRDYSRAVAKRKVNKSDNENKK